MKSFKKYLQEISVSFDTTKEYDYKFNQNLHISNTRLINNKGEKIMFRVHIHHLKNPISSFSHVKDINDIWEKYDLRSAPILSISFGGVENENSIHIDFKTPLHIGIKTATTLVFKTIIDHLEFRKPDSFFLSFMGYGRTADENMTKAKLYHGTIMSNKNALKSLGYEIYDKPVDVLDSMAVYFMTNKSNPYHAELIKDLDEVGGKLENLQIEVEFDMWTHLTHDHPSYKNKADMSFLANSLDPEESNGKRDDNIEAFYKYLHESTVLHSQNNRETTIAVALTLLKYTKPSVDHLFYYAWILTEQEYPAKEYIDTFYVKLRYSLKSRDDWDIYPFVHGIRGNDRYTFLTDNEQIKRLAKEFIKTDRIKSLRDRGMLDFITQEHYDRVLEYFKED